jgi:hypothetical protein
MAETLKAYGSPKKLVKLLSGMLRFLIGNRVHSSKSENC